MASGLRAERHAADREPLQPAALRHPGTAVPEEAGKNKHAAGGDRTPGLETAGAETGTGAAEATLGQLEKAAAVKPRRRRSPGEPMPLQLTNRDLGVLKAVNRYRYLRTGQIKRLLFPETATLQTTRRRLRKLSHPSWRYLGRIGPEAQLGDERSEMAFFLDEPGAELLAGIGETVIPYPRARTGGAGHFFLDHALGISEFRVSLELALQDETDIRLHRFVHESELKTHLRRGIKKDAYKLYHRFPHPRTQREYVVHPDALIVLAAARKQEQRRLFFLEVDRGTEPLRIIRDKVIGYHLLRESGVFRKFGDFEDFLVLTVTNSERRAGNMREALTDVPGEEDIWIAAEERITEQTVLTGAVWLAHDGQWSAVLRQG